MKFFGTTFAAAGVAFLSMVGALGHPAPRAAQTMPNEAISALDGFAVQSTTLQSSVSQLNVFNFLLQGNVISTGLVNISDSIAGFTSTISGPPFDDAGAQATISELGTFVRAHQFLLSTVIQKHSLAAGFLATGPISDALLRLTSVIDSFAFAFLTLVPTELGAANAQFTSLNATLSQANIVYSS